MAEAPRSVLRKQIEAWRKFTFFTASELEFFLFNNTFHDAAAAEYRNLAPASDASGTTSWLDRLFGGLSSVRAG